MNSIPSTSATVQAPPVGQFRYYGKIPRQHWQNLTKEQLLTLAEELATLHGETMKIISNPKAKEGSRIISAVVYNSAATRLARGKMESITDFAPVWNEGLSKELGLSRNTISSTWGELSQSGHLERQSYTDPATGKEHLQIAIKAPLSTIENKKERIAPSPETPKRDRRHWCSACGSENIRITCRDCGHVTDLIAPDLPLPNDQEEEQPLLHKNCAVIQNQLPPQICADVCTVSTEEISQLLETLEERQSTHLLEQRQEEEHKPVEEYRVEHEAAARLLVDIAGPAPEHIEMSRHGPKKYYTVYRPFGLEEASIHLQGRKTYGARLEHPDGSTRAYVFDADTAEQWQQLEQAARMLAQAGYRPLLEPSPARRGGHLWIIYSERVAQAAAYRHLCELAPELRTLSEYWPQPERGQRVRLPGGKYVSPQSVAWCHLLDAQGCELATTGKEAAPVLLASQTPAGLVPDYPPDDPASPGPECSPRTQEWPQNRREHPGQRDAYHRQKYGEETALWVVFTPQQLAAWYNSQTSVEELLPPERNKMGLAWWRGERSASVGFTPDGQGWVDFGASATRSDGKRDGGDALELGTRMSGADKAAFMREVGQRLYQEASRALLQAARSHVAPPLWVRDLMSPKGWQVYQENGGTAMPPEPQPEALKGIPFTRESEGAVPDFEQHGVVPYQEEPYDGPYPPPKRFTYCCGSGWFWQAKQQHYVCASCGQK